MVNLCAEYAGPAAQYKALGMRQLRLPTTDHFEPQVEDLERAVQFIRAHQLQGQRVYVHCRAGHGRSAAVVLAWLLHRYPTVDPQELNQELCRLRPVRSTLWKQPQFQAFAAATKEDRGPEDSKKEEDEDDDDPSASSSVSTNEHRPHQVEKDDL